MGKQFTAEDRRRIAEKVGVNEATLYQALTGKGAGFSPKKCVRIERDSDYEVRRWDLRPNDWWENWPDLIGTTGAPDVPAGLIHTPDYIGSDRRSGNGGRRATDKQATQPA